ATGPAFMGSLRGASPRHPTLRAAPEDPSLERDPASLALLLGHLHHVSRVEIGEGDGVAVDAEHARAAVELDGDVRLLGLAHQNAAPAIVPRDDAAPSRGV